jgi:putative membrane protein
MKRLISALLSVFLLLALAAPALADGEPSRKEEVVYALLDAGGKAKSIYVVNIFNGGPVTDYGDYSKIVNLTDTRKIRQTGDMISADAGAGKLYYQGTLNSGDLPWSIKISYKLDGKEIKASELAGGSGALELHIEIAQNPKANPVFFDNYALQISLQLDTALCENIVSENATIANYGGFKQLSYTVLPGRGADIKIRADVHDFEMKAISINGIRLLLDLDVDYGDFSAELARLSDAVAELDGGAGELTEGARRLSEGMKAYADGLKKYRDGVAALEAGAGDLSGGAAALSGGLAELAAQNEALLSGAQSIQQAAFDQVNAQLGSYNLNLPELTPENYASVLSASPMLARPRNSSTG